MILIETPVKQKTTILSSTIVLTACFGFCFVLGGLKLKINKSTNQQIIPIQISPKPEEQLRQSVVPESGPYFHQQTDSKSKPFGY